jgi:hypothetical protein
VWTYTFTASIAFHLAIIKYRDNFIFSSCIDIWQFQSDLWLPSVNLFLVIQILQQNGRNIFSSIWNCLMLLDKYLSLSRSLFYSEIKNEMDIFCHILCTVNHFAEDIFLDDNKHINN